MASELDGLIEKVAREVFSESLNSPELIQDTIPKVLKTRLLPLLEAGQAMRNNLEAEGYFNGVGSWDAAKRKALEG